MIPCIVGILAPRVLPLSYSIWSPSCSLRPRSPGISGYITGADALADLASWKSPDQLLQRATFVGVTRPGHELSVPLVDKLGRVILLEIDETDISSTDIRKRVSRGDSIDGLVSEVVADYIHEHDLYREPRA